MKKITNEIVMKKLNASKSTFMSFQGNPGFTKFFMENLDPAPRANNLKKKGKGFNALADFQVF